VTAVVRHCSGCGQPIRKTKTGLCGPCWSRSPQRKVFDKKYAEGDRVSGQKWYLANRERQARDHRRWCEENPDRADAHARNYEARKLELFVEHVDKRVVWRRDGGICHLCLQPADKANWQLEHVISLADGGPHCYANTAVSHPACNAEKGTESRSASEARWAEATAAYHLRSPM
jgi:5-methylcytosine-specific restriction endonuclease McrA